MKCRICGNVEGNTSFVAREMMLGLRERFEYFQCAGCGCLQIKDYPGDLGTYYPDSYYAFTSTPAPVTLRESVVGWVEDRILLGHGAIGGLCRRLRPNSNFVNLRRSRISKDARILDVGCGAGSLLRSLHRLGFANLTGADPFIDRSHEVAVGLRLVKSDLAGLDGSFDFVMLNHSLEHMPEQEQQFRHIARLLHPGGLCMIRVPLCSSSAWETYRTDWVQLDAPRHLYLHTERSVSMLASRAGLGIVDFARDSNGSQFYGSEYYRRDLTFADASRLDPPLFSRREHRDFERRARSLNRAGLGDQGAFFVRRLPSVEAPEHGVDDPAARAVASRSATVASALPSVLGSA